MIAFGTAVSEPEAYRRYAEPGIRRVAEEGAVVHAFSAVGPIARTYNLLLDAVAGLEGLEAVALVHPHAELTDPAFATKVRAALADPEVAVVGAVGARGVRGLAWWEGDVHGGPVVHRYQENGGGAVPAYEFASPSPAPAEVDVVDGFLLVLSPWAVRSLRFDERLWIGPGYDVDYCLRARAAGRKVLAADLAVVFHKALELVGQSEAFTAAHIQLAEKWASPNGAVDWKPRARRAEAEREAARAIAYFETLKAQARVDALESALEEATGSAAWRATDPLRRLNALRRRLRKP